MSNKSAQILVISVLLLVALGVTMLCSTSVFGAGAHENDVYYDVKRQVIWVAIGACGCAALALLDYHWWERTAWVGYGLTLVLLTLCFVPGVGLKINGEIRWISAKILGLSAFRFQPSELAKLAVVIGLAAWFARYPGDERTFLRGLLIPLVVAGIPVLLILGEVDMGTAVILAAACFTMLFVAGSRLRYLSGIALLGAAGLAAMVWAIPNRMMRVTALLDLDAHKMGVGLQQNLSLVAFGSGGLDGLGLGNGRLKMLYMPFAHTDFIFPMIGEELGLVFTLGVVFCFVLIVIFGMLISLHAPDRFGKLLGFGIVSLIAYQAMLNIGVTTAVFPNTGLPLPFVSYGGSNVIFCLTGIGILLNIFRQGNQRDAENFPRILRTKVTPRV